MKFQKGELKTLWPFYLDYMLSPMLHFAPAFMIVFFRDLNFSLFQIGLLLAAFPLFALIFELPTGAFADLYGRKASCLLGYFIEGIGFLSIFFFRDYYLILAAFALIGFGSTFSSGSKEAWVADLIKSKDKDYLHDYFIKSQSFDSAALVVSGLVGAFFVKIYGAQVIFIMAAISFLMSIAILTFAEEAYVDNRKKSSFKESFNGIGKQGGAAISYSKKHPVLFYFFIASAILMVSYGFNSEITWIPFLQDLGLPDYAFGYLFSLTALVGVFAPSIGKRFYKGGNERSFLSKSIFIWGILALSIFFVNSIVMAFGLIMLMDFFDLWKRPAERVYFHRYVPSNLRASIGSVETLIVSLAAIITLPAAGYVVDVIGPRYGIMIAGLFAIVAAGIYYRIRDDD